MALPHYDQFPESFSMLWAGRDLDFRLQVSSKRAPMVEGEVEFFLFTPRHFCIVKYWLISQAVDRT